MLFPTGSRHRNFPAHILDVNATAKGPVTTEWLDFFGGGTGCLVPLFAGSFEFKTESCNTIPVRTIRASWQ
jgi:hypothetical protein